MNIAIVTTQLPPLHGGAGEFVFSIVEAFANLSSHNIFVFTPEPPGEYKEKVKDNFKKNIKSKRGSASLEYLPTKTLSPFMKKITGISFDTIAGLLESHRKNSLEHVFEDIQADLIIVMDPNGLAGFPFLLGYGKTIGHGYAKKHNIPLIGYYFAHYIAVASYYPRFSIAGIRWPVKLMTKKILKECDQIMLFSEHVQTDLFHLGCKHVTVLPAEGINFKKFKALIPKKYKKNKKPTIIYFGRLMKEKNTKMICDVLLGLQEINSDFQTLVIGAGPEKKYMEERLTSKIDVTFHEWMDKKELYKNAAGAHITLNCTDFETLNLSLAEAMYLEAAPVAYYKGGHTKLIENHISGIFCRTLPEYIQTVDYLLKNPKEAARLGAGAKKRIGDILDLEKNVKNVLTYIDSFQAVQSHKVKKD